jgi:hypothetical protein
MTLLRGMSTCEDTRAAVCGSPMHQELILLCRVYGSLDADKRADIGHAEKATTSDGKAAVTTTHTPWNGLLPFLASYDFASTLASLLKYFHYLCPHKS